MKEYVIGIDIGGTYTKSGFVDREGNCYVEASIPTGGFDNVNDYLDELVTVLKENEKKLGESSGIVGIGVGVPNANYYKGTVENATNLNWKGVVPLVELLKKYYEIPVKITNDANAAALGEKIYGAAKEVNDFVMITLGTGLGSGIVVNGELVYGHDGFAGELGHTVACENGRKCNCGNSGCLETYVSSPGIKRTVFELLARDSRGSVLTDYSYADLDSEIIYHAAMKNDPVALEAFEITGKILGRKLADVVVMLSPGAIYFFGGLSRAGDYLFKPSKKWMEHFVMHQYRNKVDLLMSDLMNKNAGVLGASALIWSQMDLNS